MAQRILDGGQGFTNAGIVEHAAIFGERHIEVHPHENAVVVQGQVTNGKFAYAFTMQNSLPMSAHSGLLARAGSRPRRRAGEAPALSCLYRPLLPIKLMRSRTRHE